MNIAIPEEMTNAALWTAITAFFLPVALDLILQSGWSARVQSIVAFAVSAITGVVAAFFAGAFTGLSVVTCILLAFVVTITAYKGFWKNVAPDLKRATSVDTTPDTSKGVESTSWEETDITGSDVHQERLF